MSCFTNSIVSPTSPLSPSFDKRPLLPLLSAFFRLYAFFAFFGFIGSAFGILHRFFVIRRNVIAFIVRRFLLFFLAFLLLFMFFVFGRNREYRYACVSDFILVSSFRCTLTVTDSMRASTMMSNISMKISQPISPPFRFCVRTVLR